MIVPPSGVMLLMISEDNTVSLMEDTTLTPMAFIMLRIFTNGSVLVQNRDSSVGTTIGRTSKYGI